MARGYRAQLIRHIEALARACEGEEVSVRVTPANRTTLRWSVQEDDLAPRVRAA